MDLCRQGHAPDGIPHPIKVFIIEKKSGMVMQTEPGRGLIFLGISYEREEQYKEEYGDTVHDDWTLKNSSAKKT